MKADVVSIKSVDALKGFSLRSICADFDGKTSIECFLLSDSRARLQTIVLILLQCRIAAANFKIDPFFCRIVDVELLEFSPDNFRVCMKFEDDGTLEFIFAHGFYCLTESAVAGASN